MVAAPTIAGGGELKFSASGALVVSAPAIAGDGFLEVEPVGTGALVASASLAGAGEQQFQAMGALAVTVPSLAGAGTETFVASGALAVPAPAVAGSGTQLVNITGSGALTVLAPRIAGVGTGPAVQKSSGGPRKVARNAELRRGILTPPELRFALVVVVNPAQARLRARAWWDALLRGELAGVPPVLPGTVVPQAILAGALGPTDLRMRGGVIQRPPIEPAELFELMGVLELLDG